MNTPKPTRTQRRRARQAARRVAAEMLAAWQQSHPVTAGIIPLLDYTPPRGSYTPAQRLYA